MIAIFNANLVLENGILWDSVLLTEEDRIVAFGKKEELDIPEGTQWVDAGDAYVGPGFVDIHVHGSAEVDMRRKNPLPAVDFFLHHGTTTMLIAPGYSENFNEIMQSIELVQTAMAAGGVGKMVKGMYMEGPYTNPNYGARAYDNPWRHPINETEYTAMVDAAGLDAKVWTIAPEREGLIPFLQYARKVNPDVIFAVGHSEATPEQIRALGTKLRPAIMTHFTNATGRTNELNGIRGCGPDEYCYIDSEMYAEMICDSCGIHVKSDTQRQILRGKGLDRVLLITDGTPADGPNPPEWSYVTDLNFGPRGDLSGSKLTLDKACFNVMHHTNVGIAQAFILASRNPARVLGMDDEIGTIEVGKKANLVFVDHKFNVQKVMLDGELIN